MSKSAMTICGVPLATAALVWCVMLAAPSAQRGRRGGGADPNAGVPVTTVRIVEQPDAFYGKVVTVSAGVERVLSKTTFVIDQRKAVGVGEAKAVGAPMLVIAPYLTGTLDPAHYLLVRGEVVKLDAGTIARLGTEYKFDLAAELNGTYLGQPALLANSVINSVYTELAKKPLPPISAEERQMTAAMKIVSPSFTAIRRAAEESKADVIAENVARLKPAFTQTEGAWDDLGNVLGAQAARDARDLAAAVGDAAATGRWDVVNLSVAALNQACQNCHATYRERQEDATYRVKPGSF